MGLTTTTNGTTTPATYSCNGDGLRQSKTRPPTLMVALAARSWHAGRPVPWSGSRTDGQDAEL
jgi:YD repeat-containing protein